MGKEFDSVSMSLESNYKKVLNFGKKKNLSKW